MCVCILLLCWLGNFSSGCEYALGHNHDIEIQNSCLCVDVDCNVRDKMKSRCQGQYWIVIILCTWIGIVSVFVADKVSDEKVAWV